MVHCRHVHLFSLLLILLSLTLITSCAEEKEDSPLLPITESVAATQPQSTDAAQDDEAIHHCCVWVRPYFRKDGTPVVGHWRSKPDCRCPLSN